MHRRRLAQPLLCCTQRRSTATAAKPKPEPWDSIGPLRPPAANKWARPQLPPQTSQSSRERLPERFSRNSSSSITRRPSFSQSLPIPDRSRPKGSTFISQALRNREQFAPSPQDLRPTSVQLQRDRAPHEGLNPADRQVRNHDDGFRRRPADNAWSTSLRRRPTSRADSASQPSTSRNRPSLYSFLPENSDVNEDEKDVWNERKRFKDRGSLIGRDTDEVAIHGHSKVHAEKEKFPLFKSKVKKFRHDKKIAIDVFIPSTVSVGQLARLLKVRQTVLQRKMVAAGMQAEASYDHVLTSEYAALLAEEFGRNPIINDEAAFDIYPPPPHPEPSTLPLRPPIVTIMGHVDHGKTTLLDTLRSTSVAKGEAGGITQHIGAFSVPVADASGEKNESRTITFLDTPGHAAFSAMRARGASMTDIVVLVVAADDGVKPQTKEVIALVKKEEGKIGLIIAINKVDKPGADTEKVHQGLIVEGIQTEALGGDVPSVEVSGLTGQGLDNLVDTLSLMAEMQELRAERDGQVHGYVLESRVEKGLGPAATVLILRGCLQMGSILIAGNVSAKVRLMNDSAGAAVALAYPGMAVTVCGWKELPSAGDEVLEGSEADVKKALSNRIRKAEIEATLVDAEAINSQRIQERIKKPEDQEQQEKNTVRELRLVTKADVSGSVEAVIGALSGIGNEEVQVKIISSGVGDVSESDIMMAKASGAMIVAFSVKVPRAIEMIALQNHITVYSSKIIYQVIDEVKKRAAALLPKTFETKVTGEVTVLQLFDINITSRQTRTIAGCRVTNGLVEKSRPARVVRNGEVLHAGHLDTLKQLKKDVTEVKKGSECGISFENFSDLREGDLIQLYQEIEIPRVL